MKNNEIKQNRENESLDEQEKEENKEENRTRRRPVKKTQGQLLQEALGLEPEDIQGIENKLYLCRFLDYFATESLDFIFKDRSIEQYEKQISSRMESFETGNEEDKLIKKSFENKQIIDIIHQLKTNGEELARSKGINQAFDKRMRKLSLLVTLPMFGVMIILTLLAVDILFLFPLLCLFCFLPQIIRGSVVKKWTKFKEENRNQFYEENREDIIILKGFTGEILNLIRSRLLELKVPLKLISFPLYSSDYENLVLKNKSKTRGGLNQFLFHFEYPEGMEPFPIPESLQRYQQPIAPETKRHERPEKNFIVLEEIKAKDGIIESFTPTLKDAVAEKINETLNNCEFTTAPEDFRKIIPEYSPKNAIFCICGKVAEIINVQICNWKKQFEFYLFEGKECECGEKIFALSLMDDKSEVPEELNDIF
ncbi:MAG: hypothetical protein ACTSRI_03075 [Promethearchaeota archaeon]